MTRPSFAFPLPAACLALGQTQETVNASRATTQPHHTKEAPEEGAYTASPPKQGLRSQVMPHARRIKRERERERERERSITIQKAGRERETCVYEERERERQTGRHETERHINREREGERPADKHALGTADCGDSLTAAVSRCGRPFFHMS